MIRLTHSAFGAGAALLLAASSALAAPPEVTPKVWQALDERERIEVIIEPRVEAPDLRTLPDLGFEQRMALAVETLQAAAKQSQAPLLAELDALGASYRAFWVANAVVARLDRDSLQRLAGREDLRRITLDAPQRQALPAPQPKTVRAPEAIEWGVQRVNAPALWAMGARGQGVVIAGQDTGYEWSHPALIARYRGWNGSSADHNHNWRDAIGSLTHIGINPCGVSAMEPCDDNGHGTHTMGTMVGDDGGANQIGIAPDARWIGCRNMDRGDGRPSTYMDCFEWFMAPTDLSGNNADPSRAPHIINNSWGCPPSEGCLSVDVLKQTVENVRNAGILVVVSAGNSGSSCGSINTAPSPYAASFTVGATNSSDLIANFSSRGPGLGEDPSLPKPDLSAPGVSIRSSVRGGAYASFNGTSMAGPHVAGVAALLMSLRPSLRGRPAKVEALLRKGARPVLDLQNCGAFPGSQVPNAVYGYGIVDALRSAELLLFEDGFEALPEKATDQ